MDQGVPKGLPEPVAVEPKPIVGVELLHQQAGHSAMTAMSRVREHMEVIGADGVHVGTVDRVEENRIKLTKADSGEGRHRGHHHYIDSSLVADVEGNKVRLSANGDVAVTMEQEG
jgi:hypothetical protein